MKFKLENTFAFFSKRLLKGIMKILMLLSCVTIFGFSPNSGFTQNIDIDNDKTISVEEVFKLIKGETGYEFVYRNDLIANAPAVSLKKGTIKVDALLKQVLYPIHCQYELDENTIIVKQSPQQDIIKLRGKVTDARGMPIPGVNVIIKSYTIGIATDFDGTYALPVRKNDIIVFSALSFKTQEIKIEGQSIGTDGYITINVQLQDDIESLDEVIVVSDGYRSIDKEREPGAYFSVDKKQIEKQITNNIVGSLEGLVPGLTFNNTSGAGPGLFIRGIGSFNSVAPLFVLDGFPVRQSDLNLINPLDIESVTVLKDASASSIWGAGAANGVIVITTKRGTKNKKTSFTFNTSLSITPKPRLSSLNLMNSREVIEYERDYFTLGPFDRTSRENNNIPFSLAQSILMDNAAGNITNAEMENQFNQLASINNTKDIENAFLNSPIERLTNLSFNGQSGDLGYYGSLVFNTTESTFKGGDSNKFNAIFNTDYQFSKATKLSLGINYVLNDNKQSPISSGLLYISPFERLYDENGNPAALTTNYPQSTIDKILEYGGKDLTYKPLNDFNDYDYKSRKNSTRLSATINQNLFDGVSALGSFQYLSENSISDYLYKETSYYTRNFLTSNSEGIITDNPDGSRSITGIGNQLYPDGSILDKNLSDYYSIIGRLQLNLNKSFNEGKHIIDASLGLERRKFAPETNGQRYYGYNEGNLVYNLVNQIPESYTNVFGLMVRPQLSSRIDKFDERTSAYFFNSTYSYNKKYHLNVSARRDRSSQFTLGKQYLGSVGLKWNLAKENFLKSNKIKRLDLRSSWGIVGNSPGVSVSSTSTSGEPGVNSYTGENSMSILFPPNLNLKFETVETLNLGLDFSLFSNRLSGSIDVYNKNSSNILAPGPIDPTNGFNSITQNIAKINNKGIETQFFTKNIVSTNFQWTTNTIFSYYKNNVEGSVIQKTLFNTRGRAVNLEGYPAYSIFAYQNADLSEVDGSAQTFYTDENGEKQITNNDELPVFDDLVHVGVAAPTLGIDLSNTIEYKGLQLYFRFTYKGGHVIRKENITAIPSGRSNYNRAILNYWKQPGDEKNTNIPSLASQYLQTNFLIAENSARRYMDADFIKLRQVILSYKLSNAALKQIPFNNVSIAAQADNLWYWAKNSEGIDPEAYSTLGGRKLEIKPTFSMRLTLGF